MGKSSHSILWDDLLRADPDRARADYSNMISNVMDQDLTYAGRFVQCVLKPDIITQKNEKDYANSGGHILSAIEKAVQYILQHPDNNWWSSVDPALAELLRLPNPLENYIQIARLDGCLNSGIPKYLECNADSPAGFAYASVLQDALLDTDIARDFSTHYRIKHENYIQSLCQFLAGLYEQTKGSSLPGIAIVDWRDARTASEFRLIVKALQDFGFSAQICDPRDMQLRGGKLFANDERVQLVYRRVIVQELAQRSHQCKDFIRAAKEQAALFVNPFGSAIGSCKQLLTRLRMGEFRKLLSDPERKAVRKHLMFSYMLNSDSFKSDSKQHDTLQYTLDHQDELVIKPIRAYGGDDIHFGSELNKRQWRNIVTALKNDLYICQEWIDIPVAQVPVFTPDMNFRNMKMITNPFFLGGDYIGCLTRLAQGRVVNVGAGGMPQANITLR